MSTYNNVLRSYMGEGPEMDATTNQNFTQGPLNRAKSLVGASPLVQLIDEGVRYQAKTTLLHNAETIGDGPIQYAIRASLAGRA